MTFPSCFPFNSIIYSWILNDFPLKVLMIKHNDFTDENAYIFFSIELIIILTRLLSLNYAGNECTKLFNTILFFTKCRFKCITSNTHLFHI